MSAAQALSYDAEGDSYILPEVHGTRNVRVPMAVRQSMPLSLIDRGPRSRSMKGACRVGDLVVYGDPSSEDLRAYTTNLRGGAMASTGNVFVTSYHVAPRVQQTTIDVDLLASTAIVVPPGAPKGAAPHAQSVAEHLESLGRIPTHVKVTPDGAIQFYFFPRSHSPSHGFIEVDEGGAAAIVGPYRGDIQSWELKTANDWDRFFQAVSNLI